MDDEIQRNLDAVRDAATTLAETLRDASDAGVPHGLILPQLVLVFKEAFGDMPPNVAQQLAGMQQ